MPDNFNGCMLGAAIGDALGMPNESTSPNLKKMRFGYRRAFKGHPNAGLGPGQYTDDTQLMILAGSLLADGRFNEERYASALKDLYARGGFRFPDGSISAACEHMLRDAPMVAGVKSTTAGCLPIAVPFALSYPGLSESIERAVRACNVTHTHPAAHAAVSTLVVLIYYALNGSNDAIAQAEKKASVEDETLGGRIRNALMLSREGVDTETAVLKIGHDVSVYQTLPLSLFLISKYQEYPADLLTVAANVGGNTDTIAFICGAYIGAKKGAGALPSDLLEGLEDRQKIELLSGRLRSVYQRRLDQV
ncbi:MAG TPA: ADP-ribosylglycohydrolase family protein [Methanoregulaceae archaeon]|nr:ADP-ribosylglycohydrolase family protein [Methanoregulaceae archaeon]HPD75038.1 ADP-ribosylglycohydrolase family protein [Methanoregulaceae archaeon]HRY75673.1 ADP-ribosylglycohydrolase family protein [Methanoregulaceae archaeon]